MPLSGRSLLNSAAVLIGASWLVVSIPIAPGTLRASMYDMRTATRVSGDSMLISGLVGIQSDWTARVTIAGRRGRFDVTGGQPLGFAVGDFVLFDATGHIVMHPPTREAAITPADTQTLNTAMASVGMRVTVDSLTTTVDSTGAVEFVNGRKARTWQAIISYRTLTELDSMPVGLDVPAMTGRTTMVMRYWLGDVDSSDFAAPMFGAAATSPLASRIMASLNDRVVAAQVDLMARLPKLPVLKSSTAVETVISGHTSRIEFTMEQSNWKSGPVDARRLIVPEDYRLVVRGRTSMTEADSKAFTHWRTPPG